MKDDKPPKGGWLGPPSTEGLDPIAMAVPGKNGQWKWKNQELTRKQEKRHSEFARAMREADKEGIWRFDYGN